MTTNSRAPEGYLILGLMKSNVKTRPLRAIAKARGYKHYRKFAITTGRSCPGARECLAYVDDEGTIIDGPEQRFRCFAAVMESNGYRMGVGKTIRANRLHNYQLLLSAYREGGTLGIYDLIFRTLEWYRILDRTIIRWHEGGDFFNFHYLKALCEVAERTPSNLYYGYTKSVHYLVQAIELGIVPDNLRLIASRGGRYDWMISEWDLPEAVVVASEDEARELGLEVDHDDSHAAFGRESFALVVHGQQPKGRTFTRLQPVKEEVLV